MARLRPTATMRPLPQVTSARVFRYKLARMLKWLAHCQPSWIYINCSAGDDLTRCSRSFRSARWYSRRDGVRYSWYFRVETAENTTIFALNLARAGVYMARHVRRRVARFLYERHVYVHVTQPAPRLLTIRHVPTHHLHHCVTPPEVA